MPMIASMVIIYDTGALFITHCTNSNGLCFSSAPPGAPEMFKASAGERQVNFTWSPPPQTLPSVLITSYTVYCTPSLTSLPLSTPTTPFSSITRVVEGFSPNTVYNCSVIAENSVRVGPPANASFTTLQDCEKKHLHIVDLSFKCTIIPFRFLHSVAPRYSSRRLPIVCGKRCKIMCILPIDLFYRAQIRQESWRLLLTSS